MYHENLAKKELTMLLSYLVSYTKAWMAEIFSTTLWFSWKVEQWKIVHVLWCFYHKRYLRMAYKNCNILLFLAYILLCINHTQTLTFVSLAKKNPNAKSVSFFFQQETAQEGANDTQRNMVLERRVCSHSNLNADWFLIPFRTKTPTCFFPRGNKPLLYHQIGNRNVFIFITNQWNLMCCVDKIIYEHLAILSNLKSCQFALRKVIFNICLRCQFEDSQIISPKIIPMSHSNI